ncbi:GNAT family N-acetyltransferase [Oceanicella sp. SM1341]|uniref:GNAT family N-acetyltransferase n=1 Tax=Oceanicella sp. SM1341 TaxID=1548889 RepID=UPI0013005454|nr:GNAT family N-acetyltransferase [Oceanicella sp. SM1341]
MDQIETPRLHGRPCRAEDKAHVTALFGTEEIRRWASPPGLVWSAERYATVTRRLAAHWASHGWGPRLWFEGRSLVGIAGLQFAVLDGLAAVEIAFAVLPAAQRRGFATEMLAATLSEAGGITRRVDAAVLEDNAASRLLLSREGFRQVGSMVEDGRRLLLLERSLT